MQPCLLKDCLMRLSRWFGSLVGALASLTGAESVLAQQPYPQSPYGVSGSAVADPTGSYFQVANGQAPNTAAYPNNYMPWPQTSPYEMNYGQTANENGQWMYDSQTQAGMKANWKFRSEYIRAHTEKTHGYYGHRLAPDYKTQLRAIAGPAQAGGGGAGAQGGLLGALTQFEGIPDGRPGFNYFDPVAGTELDAPRLNGFRLTLERLNEDGSGLELFGQWARETDTEYNAREEAIHRSKGALPEVLDVDTFLQIVQSRAPGLILAGGTIDPSAVPGRVGPYQSLLVALQSNLLNLRGLPLDDGTIQVLPGGIVVGGATAVYDLNFQVGLQVEQYGSGLRWQTTPWIKTDTFRLSPTAGVRYMSLTENFNFFGQHSGWTYGSATGGGAGGGGGNQATNPDVLIHSIPNFFDDDRDGVIDPAGSFEGGGAGGGAGGAAGAAGTFLPPSNGQIYPVTSILANNVQSQLLGPELGFNYQLGGDHFKIGGRSQFALLANYERIRMSGDNIFVTTRQGNLNQPSIVDPRPNDFTDSKTTTHVSPLFEQSVYLEGQFLKYVPLVRRSSFLQGADVRVGYTYTFMTEITRADDSILWQGNPAAGLFPEIDAKRSTWRSNTLNLGITWNW